MNSLRKVTADDSFIRLPQKQHFPSLREEFPIHAVGPYLDVKVLSRATVLLATLSLVLKAGGQAADCHPIELEYGGDWLTGTHLGQSADIITQR